MKGLCWNKTLKQKNQQKRRNLVEVVVDVESCCWMELITSHKCVFEYKSVSVDRNLSSQGRQYTPTTYNRLHIHTYTQ